MAYFQRELSTMEELLELLKGNHRDQTVAHCKKMIYVHGSRDCERLPQAQVDDWTTSKIQAPWPLNDCNMWLSLAIFRPCRVIGHACWSFLAACPFKLTKYCPSSTKSALEGAPEDEFHGLGAVFDELGIVFAFDCLSAWKGSS